MKIIKLCIMSVLGGYAGNTFSADIPLPVPQKESKVLAEKERKVRVSKKTPKAIEDIHIEIYTTKDLPTIKHIIQYLRGGRYFN